LISDDDSLRNSLYRNMLAFSAWQGSAYALERANTLRGFGLDLNSMTSIHPDKAMEAGAQVLRTAIAEYPAGADARDVASLQLLLANTLANLSEAGISQDSAEEIGLYHDALKALPKERDPWMWSSIQYGLAVTLAELGKEQSGTQHLAEAVQIFNEVLTVRTRDSMLYEWATTQAVLGECLSALAELEPGRGYRAQTVAAEKSALEVLTPQADPAAWARAQAALGIALSNVGREDNAPEKLQEAISALRLGATKELRTRAPIAWG
jgi:tetratricopeptide (TPR) repeat protein